MLVEPRLSKIDSYKEIFDYIKEELKDVYAVVRVQSCKTRTIVLTNEISCQVDTRIDEGIGLQLYSSFGKNVFVSTDEISQVALKGILFQAFVLLKNHADVDSPVDFNWAEQSSLQANRILRFPSIIDKYTLNENIILLKKRHNELMDKNTRLVTSNTTSFSATDDEWRIFRSDGTDVHFNTYRTMIKHRFTLKDSDKSTTLSDSCAGTAEEYLTNDSLFDIFLKRIENKIKLGSKSLYSEMLPGGHYNIIIDAGMAKGLAHEAFGHSCESDVVLDGSILSTKDLFYKKDLVVANDTINIIDEPIFEDWADQPFSANGFLRERVDIVKNGILKSALADSITAQLIGVKPTGAERVERFDYVPIPRMTNIRLESNNFINWNRQYGLVLPEELFSFLQKNNIISSDEEWLFLEGYMGGQVNCITGDYVFNSMMIHRFSNGEISTHLPSVFSGQVLKTLANIRCMVGPLELSRLGICGKVDQKVPSSGGGHLFTLINSCDGVMIGGR